MPQLIDLSGLRFGRWAVLRQSSNRKKWECVCECGATGVVAGQMLRVGRSKSCGCLRAEMSRARMQGPTFHAPTKISWRKMLERCENKKDIGYARYGGRGISVCARWHSYEHFAIDMGARPDGTSLDRINSNGNYEPGNCRWALRAEQAVNRRSTRWVVVAGERMCLKDAARRLSLDYYALRYQLARGRDVEGLSKDAA